MARSFKSYLFFYYPQDVFILSGMFVEQAYGETLDEKEQQKQRNNEDDGDDLII
jgi:hypothetical protein